MNESRFPGARPLTLALCLVLVLAGAGCRLTTPHPRDAQPKLSSVERPDHGAVREHTRRTFARAVYISPGADQTADLPAWMAPLLVQEMGGGALHEAAVSFGAVRVNTAGRAELDTNQQAIYFLSDQVMLAGRDRAQLTFLWFYPPAGAGQLLRQRGFRMVLDEAGFGVLWEVLSSDDALRVFHVSESLERMAAQAFGPPCPGRQFSVEPSLEARPEVVVARVLADGPEPMGPFVYLDGRALAVTTLLCRCMPAQVEKLERRASYRLVRLAGVTDLVPGGVIPPNLPLPDLGGRWDELLRLPPDLRTGR